MDWSPQVWFLGNYLHCSHSHPGILIKYTPQQKQRDMELTGFMDSPWSGSAFTFPSKSLLSKFTILYLMLFREPLLSQDLMKRKKHLVMFLMYMAGSSMLF